MKPRIEQKLEIESFHYLDFLKWINNQGGKTLYPERIICSRYFDNKNMQMYFDTVEGLVPRKKIRIRTYGSEDFVTSNSYSLEVKMSTEYSKLKKTYPNINLKSFLHDGYFDKSYGFCYGILDISYIREYFIVKGIRVTIDKEIKFSLVSFNRNFKKKSFLDKSYVFEIKADINTNLSFLLNNFNFPRSRFSKYERAVEALIE